MISSPSSASSLSSKAAKSDLFDQSALSDLAERLVEAAKRAGADAADAVAVRGVSQGVEVRDGRVEESERSEGDDVGLRVLVGFRQAVVSTNDVSGDGVARLAERAVAMAKVAPDDKYVGLADPALLARDFPDLDLTVWVDDTNTCAFRPEQECVGGHGDQPSIALQLQINLCIGTWEQFLSFIRNLEFGQQCSRCWVDRASGVGHVGWKLAVRKFI